MNRIRDSRWCRVPAPWRYAVGSVAVLALAQAPAAAQDLSTANVTVDLSVLDDGGWRPPPLPGAPGLAMGFPRPLGPSGLMMPGASPPASRFYGFGAGLAPAPPKAAERAPGAKPAKPPAEPKATKAPPAKTAKASAPPPRQPAPRRAPAAAPPPPETAAAPPAPPKIAAAKPPERAAAPPAVQIPEPPRRAEPLSAAPARPTTGGPSTVTMAIPPPPAPAPSATEPPQPPPAMASAPPPPPARAPAASATPPAKGAPAKPVEQAQLPAAGAAAVGRALQIPFAGEEPKLTDAVKSSLKGIADKLKADDNLRLQLSAYAKGQDLSASRARRLSLSRALAVRTFLIDSGVRSTRIEVRALGDKVTDDPPNRVDVAILDR